MQEATMTSSFESSDDRGSAEFVSDDDLIASATTLAANAQRVVSTADEARQQGFEAGEAAARASLPWKESEALISATHALTEASAALMHQTTRMNATQPRLIVELALSIAEHLLCKNLGEDADALVDRVGHAIAQMPPQRPLVLELAPRDAELLQASEDRVARFDENVIEVRTNESLAPGEFRIESGSSEIDGRRDAMLAVIREALEEECREAKGTE